MHFEYIVLLQISLSNDRPSGKDAFRITDLLAKLLFELLAS
jgi:hypothetical protein